MKTSFIQQNTIVFIILLLVFSSIATAHSFQNNIKIITSENQLFLGNSPPETPDISGPTMGKPEVELDYQICSTDPEENDIIYCFDWGDDSGEVCIGPFPSGEEVTISHSWLENGTYTITVKAADTLGDESGLATLKVRISNSRSYSHSKNLFFNLLHLLRRMNEGNFKLLSIIEMKI
jgi:hypothetical protein